MIYDRPIGIYTLPAGSPLQHTLAPFGSYLCAEREVFHARYWESVQSGSRIDMMAELPFGRDISATMYAIPADGHVYRVEQAQHGLDANGLPITVLSLMRMEGNYDIADPD